MLDSIARRLARLNFSDLPIRARLNPIVLREKQLIPCPGAKGDPRHAYVGS